MKKVFTADKGSYGTGFFSICDSLEELKKEIVRTYYMYGIEKYSEDMYSEELFLTVKEEGQYTLYEVDLHDEEEIDFREYDGKSDFYIKKKEVKILSKSTCL